MAKTFSYWQQTLCALLTVAIVSYVGTRIYNDWQEEAPFRKAEAEKQRVAAITDRMWDARSRLQADRAVIPYDKRCLPFEYTDLSDWKPRNYSISELAAFQALPETPGTIPTLKIRLGPAVDSEVVPILCELHELEKLDVNGAMLADSEIADVLAAHPNCQLGEFEFPD